MNENAKQEVITPEQARFIREHERATQRWASTQRAEMKSASFFVLIALPLWVISYFASGGVGSANQPVWFASFALVCFVGAVGASIGAVVFWVTRTMTTKPVKDHNLPDVRLREYDE